MGDWSRLFPVTRTPSDTSPVPSPASDGLHIDLREEFDSLVRFEGVPVTQAGGGASNLFELTIDTDKDWEGFSIKP